MCAALGLIEENGYRPSLDELAVAGEPGSSTSNPDIRQRAQYMGRLSRMAQDLRDLARPEERQIAEDTPYT